MLSLTLGRYMTKGWVSKDGHPHFGVYVEKYPCVCGGKLFKQFETDSEALKYFQEHPPKISHKDLVKKRKALERLLHD